MHQSATRGTASCTRLRSRASYSSELDNSALASERNDARRRWVSAFRCAWCSDSNKRARSIACAHWSVNAIRKERSAGEKLRQVPNEQPRAPRVLPTTEMGKYTLEPPASGDKSLRSRWRL